MPLSSQSTIGVAILTYCAARHLTKCLTPWLESPLRPRVLVIDSSSPDGTANLAKALGVEVIQIPKEQFNHGATRELARQHLATDIVVMCTQDAYAYSSDTLQKLIDPLLQNRASLAYARQLPHEGAGLLEKFARQFNYPSESHQRGFSDINKYGVYTFFCSNSCAAYSNKALDEIGGFAPTLLGEDTVAAAKLIHRGHRIAYVAEALVHHSHNYSLKEEFCRYFDTGAVRQAHRHLIALGGGDAPRGKAYAIALVKRVWQEDRALLPYALLHIGAKWLGYQLGKHASYMPGFLKQKCSSQPYYWQSDC